MPCGRSESLRLRALGSSGRTHLLEGFLKTRGRLVLVELELLLHSRQPRLALLQGVLVAHMLLELAVQALVDLRINNPWLKTEVGHKTQEENACKGGLKRAGGS